MAKPKPRKTRRATRQPKTNFTRVQTDCDPWRQPPNLDFEKLERVYVSLPQNAREEIISIVQRYLWQDQSAHEAFSVRDVEAAIDDLEKPVKKLIAALDTGSDNNVETAVRSFVDSFAKASEISCSELLCKLQGFRLACDAARAEIVSNSRKSGFKDGDGWRGMVRRLLDFAKRHGFPCTVAKRNETRKNPSKFVALERTPIIPYHIRRL